MTLDEKKAVLVAACGIHFDALQARHPEQVGEFLRQEDFSTLDQWTAEQLERGPAYDALLDATAKEISIGETIKIVVPMILKLASSFFPGIGVLL